MSSSERRPSAVIYQFPVGGRAAAKTERPPAAKITTSLPPVAAVTACGSAWYHAAAIAEDDVEPSGD